MSSEGETQNNIHVTHKSGGIIANTIGRVGVIPEALLLGTPSTIFKNIPEEHIKQLEERYKDVNWQGQVDVNLNHSPLLKQLARLFQKGRRINPLFRWTFGLVDTGLINIQSKLTRENYYNPWSESAVVFNKAKGIGEHEIGHAQDFDKSKHPTLKTFSRLLPIVPLIQEWKASQYAMKNMAQDERKQAQKVLEPAFGSYLGYEAAKIISAAMLYTSGVVNPLVSLLPLGGILAGHIKSRFINKNIFFNGKPVNQQTLQSASAAPALAAAA